MRFVLCLALLLVLAACGTGDVQLQNQATDDGGTDGGGDGGVSPESTHVLLRPSPLANVEDILDDLEAAGGEVVRIIQDTAFVLVAFPPGTDLDEVLAELDADARVADSERDRLVSAPEGGGATLPVGSELFHFSVVPDQSELLRIGAGPARERASGVGVRVAVIDSGVVATHAALAGRVEPGGWDFVGDDPDPTEEPNGLDDDGDGLIDEGFGHGTFVSSLVLALAADARIVPYRVLGSDNVGQASDVAEAITRAANDGVDVINLSLGMEHGVKVVGEAIQYARSLGVMVVASAGNTGLEEVTFPATISAAFSVTSVDAEDLRAFFSSYGSDVDLNAPGVELLGAYPVDPESAVAWSGTSFSAALVSGAFALVRERFPELEGEQILGRLAETAVDNEGLNEPFDLGRGRLDLDAATQEGE